VTTVVSGPDTATIDDAPGDPPTPVRDKPPRNWSAIGLVMRKDLTAVKRSKAIMLPMILVPAVLLIAMPVALGLFARSAPTSQLDTALSSPMISNLAKPILQLPQKEQLIVLVLGYLLSPLLLVIPLMVSAVLAADAFAGEKERRTLDGLLYLPISDRDLFLAKVLGAFAPALAITWIGAIVYATLSNVIGWPVTHRLFIPFTQWTMVMVWIAPAIALLALGLLVIVSSRARTTQEANQLGGAVILPLIFLAAGEASALLLAPLLAIFLVGVVIWGIAVGLLVINGRRFTRDRLATSS